MTKSRRNRNASLKNGRPPIDVRIPSSIHSNRVNARQKSSKATRALINLHHQLHKSRAAAVSAGNDGLIKDIDAKIQQLGGLEAYQAASLTGQDRDRGGDSSEKLVEWLREYGLVSPTIINRGGDNLRVLEIGALSSRNAISNVIGKGIQSVRRIDLHSQEPDRIEEIDFMDLPLPTSNSDRFDIVSLSLVLNYVPEVPLRGEMLRRTTRFLRQVKNEQRHPAEDQERLPCLFMVLPLPCLRNSRYMTHDHFVSIMASLDYVLIEHHDSQKLSYMLFHWTGSTTSTRERNHEYKKIEINPGKSRNNFGIVLQSNSG